jgi:hypothetical protein
VTNVTKLLHELHFLTQHRLIDVQMGADLLFWYHYTQEFKQVIWRDQYIPALKYRSTTAPTAGNKSGRKTKQAAITETFEIYPGWEIVSEQYEQLVESYTPMMPPFCAAAVGVTKCNERVVWWSVEGVRVETEIAPIRRLARH